jgi:hypothetical protein
MDFDLRQAIENLEQSTVFELANQGRPPSDYLFNAILPSINMDTYDVANSTMTIRTTMAGLSGMDSKYSPGGASELSEASGRTGKITITSDLPEQFLRQLQNLLLRLTAQNQSTENAIQQTGLNFVNKIIVQALFDREEWLKGQALFTGALDWTFNGKNLKADYGIPSGNFLTARTGNDAYGGSTSKWWTDYYAAQEILGWKVTSCIMHPTTLKVIMTNSEVNQLQFVTADPATNTFVFQRLISRGGNTVLSSDPRDFITIIAYNKEGEIWDLDNPGETVKVPFCPVGGVLWTGERIDAATNIFVVGEGGTTPPELESPVLLGYGHVAPTTEGGGLPGRWSRLYVPQDKPYSISADGVSNFIPVIQAPKRLVIGTTTV